MIIVGIDPSINSTGICVIDEKNTYYYLIVSKTTKKMREIKGVEIIEYDYQSSKDLKSYQKENSKSLNVYNISKEIEKIIKKWNPDIVYMEAVAFAASGTIDQLAGLNYSIRNIILDNCIKLFVVSPTTIKMLSVGNGQATKEDIINTWKNLDKKTYENCKEIKCDDLADAYMIAHLNLK